MSLAQEHNHITEQQVQQRSTPQMDNSIMETGHTEENKLPKICVNDKFISMSPSPVSLKLNNIKKLGRTFPRVAGGGWRVAGDG